MRNNICQNIMLMNLKNNLCNLIKEYLMIETIFEIGKFNKQANPVGNQSLSSYNTLCQSFCSTSYALYTEYFIKRIAAEAQAKHNDLLKYSLKRNLRNCVKKFMLTDLQLLFLAFYCERNNWKIQNRQHFTNLQFYEPDDSQHNQEHWFSLFVQLNAFFVKSYVGNAEQFEAIKVNYRQTFPKFEEVFQKWVISIPKQNFIISPREINELYRNYSRNCQIQTSKKDYNQLVNTIIDLSTSYSMIPNKRGEKRQKEKQRVENVQENGYFQNEMRTKDKSKIASQKFNSDIFQIAQKSQIIQDQELPKFGKQDQYPISRRSRRKSSFIFESLQSLSRKSEQLGQSQIIGNVIEQQKIKEDQVQKKSQGPKISLNFLKKKQKPNETVIGFLGQQTNFKVENEQKTKVQNNKDNNMSFINLRSNRSSRSNSQLPFLWKPSQDNFFEKSKFG